MTNDEVTSHVSDLLARFHRLSTIDQVGFMSWFAAACHTAGQHGAPLDTAQSWHQAIQSYEHFLGSLERFTEEEEA